MTGDTLTLREREAVLFIRRVRGVTGLARAAGVSVGVLGDALMAEPLPAYVVAGIRDALRLALS